MRGHCLGAEDIRDRIIRKEIIVPESNLRLDDSGKFVDPNLEGIVQPTSLDARLDGEAYILDAETHSIFKPRKDASVWRTLLELPMRQRQRVAICDGFEMKVGFTYLLPLFEKLHLKNGEYVKASPKSSFGRLFLYTRLLADYHHSFDQVVTSHDKTIDLWLLVQPLAFNIIMHPALACNQLRFFQGFDAKLTTEETIDEFKKEALLYIRQDAKFVPATPTFAANEGLQLHLDISGENNHGIAGLRARKNPNPIDTSKRGYQAEEYFEPQRTKDLEKMPPGQYYLIASREVLNIPGHLSSELRPNSHLGLSGPLHFAGFIDPGFSGDLVFEIRSDEIGNSRLTHEMPISTLDIFRTNKAPNKQYGKEIGSTYKGQKGPQPSKFFGPFDSAHAARNYQKLNRMVLVQDARALNAFRQSTEGFEPIAPERVASLEDIIHQGMFHSRYDCEQDEQVLQAIPYLVIFGPDNTIFSYQRAENMQHFGEKRLFGKISIGVGGHIQPEDGPKYITTALTREREEEVTITGNVTAPRLAGTLLSAEKPVDRVHFGLVYIMSTTGSVQPKEPALVKGCLTPIRDFLISSSGAMETWTQKLIPYVESLHRLSY